MKPQLIQGPSLTRLERLHVADWLKMNGCPWMVLEEDPIHITGNHFTVRTLTIKNTRQARTLWPRHLPEGWKMPSKIRKYRIRHELRWTP